MGERDDGYQAIIRAVHGRWRRRFLLLCHLIIAVISLPQIASISTIVETYANPQTGAQESFTWTSYTAVIETPAGQVWATLVLLHLLYILIAELRDRAVRREIERERKWRLLEGLEWAQPEVRERVVRLAESRDGALVDFDAAAWEANVTSGKRKRG